MGVLGRASERRNSQVFPQLDQNALTVNLDNYILHDSAQVFSVQGIAPIIFFQLWHVQGS